MPDVLEAHHTVASSRDDHSIELARRFEFALGLDGHLTVEIFNPATGELDVLLAERPLDIDDGDLVRSHLLRVEPQAHREPLLATNEDRRNSGDSLEPVLDLLFGEGGEFERR